MKPNCQEPVGESSHCVDLNACCASDILILNGWKKLIIWKNPKHLPPTV